MAAIKPDGDPAALPFIELNRRMAVLWPEITVAKPPPADADAWAGVGGKYPDEFDPKPGTE